MRVVRRFHKWLMAILAVQFLIWSITGMYMVYFNIHYIHGDLLVHNHQKAIDPSKINVTVAHLQDRFPTLASLTLKVLIELPVYQIDNECSKLLIDATNGNLLSPIDESLAKQIAIHAYTGKGAVTSVLLFKENQPFEVSSRHLPVWQVQFDDFALPSLYISAQSGAIVTKRHSFWRLFDWMFRFHIMDYETSEVDNWLLWCTTLLGLLSCGCGLYLVFSKLASKRSRSSNRAMR
ncbi:PepSY domain-containing protein [Thalassotalea eurytherma]|uniref:PepSY domain-containing protein n=1 Tax=Thalassotalea eurytherma TaxID=1144278 RepID=A0ABQ6H2V2_9GAMM|nr:PepSY domain-containing protein [Thalassotalea eurytherma]GLX81907.1 hypothetical protein theurythT_13590 [Thalassotalea eurytherma]